MPKSGAAPHGVDTREVGPSDLRAVSVLARETYTETFGNMLARADLADILEHTCSEAALARALHDGVILVAFEHERRVGFIEFGAPHYPLHQSRSRAEVWRYAGCTFCRVTRAGALAARSCRRRWLIPC